MTPERLAEIKEYMAKHDQESREGLDSGFPRSYVGFPARNAMMRELIIEVERLRTYLSGLASGYEMLVANGLAEYQLTIGAIRAVLAETGGSDDA